MAASEEITLKGAQPSDSSLLAHLLEFYMYDLAEIFALKLRPDGRFGYDKLPLYWSEPETHFPYLIRCNSDVAGFALVTRGSTATDNPDDLDLAEFFVLRPYRRHGIGRRAAFLLWDQLPGQWIVRVSEMNREGLPFWEAAIRAYTLGAYAQTRRPGKSHMFRVFSFSNATAKSVL